MRHSFSKWYRNISITKKLYFVVGIMALLITIELFTLWFSLTTLSSVRAFVAGEGLWSKAQKDAVYNLQKYARTRQTSDYMEFLYFMNVPLGDHRALMEVTHKNPNIKSAQQGFLRGRNHSKDIDGMINLFQRFHNIYYIKKAINIWLEADSTVAELIPIGEQLYYEISSENPSEAGIDKIVSKIDPLNQKLTFLEDDFSYTLGEGARWLENLILTALFLIVLTVELSGLFLTISVSMGITRGINEIVRISKKVAAADFTNKARVFSEDEIGLLAVSFNEMIDNLQATISEWTQAEELRNQQQQLYESLIKAQSEMGLGLTISDNKKIIFANEALYKMYGYGEDEVFNMSSFMDLLVPEDREKLTAQFKKRLSGFENSESDMGEAAIVRKDGTIINIEYSVKIVKMDGRTQVLSVARDITARKQAQEELKNKAEELIRSNKELEQFAYVASHDLREPLRTISGYVQLLKTRYKNQLDEDANDFINYTVDGVQRMDKLINDLLAYSMVSKKQEKVWVDCSEILETVTTNISDIIRENKVKITFDNLPIVKSSSLLMIQLFQNLITNAIKFHSDKPPQINIFVKEHEKEWLFSVQDNGIGLDEKYAEKIFVIFQRLHTRDVYEGTGIGLAICKKIVEQHGGKIWLESKLGQGTTFYFTIKKA